MAGHVFFFAPSFIFSALRVPSTFDGISGALGLTGTSRATFQRPPGGKHAAFAFQVGVSVFLQLDD